MSLSVRCTTCQRVIGVYEETIEYHTKQGRSREYIMNNVLGDKVPPKRWCCRIILMTYIDTTQRLMMYNDPTLASDTWHIPSDAASSSS